MSPVTVPEWTLYIQNLEGDDLRNQAINANSFSFVRTLMSEGFDMDGVQQVVGLFARRMVQVGMLLPSVGAFDMEELASKDALAFLL